MDEQMLGTLPPSAAPAALGASGASVLGEWRHSLLVLEGQQPGRRIELDNKPLVLGRRTAADLVLPELQVSGLHCRVQIEAGRPALKVTDFKSTNGSFINGQRITGSAYLAPGGTLAVGQHLFRHDFLSPERLVRAAYDDAEREQTVAAWLPVALSKGPVHTDFCYRPAEPPRGAGFAVLPLAGDRLCLIVIDVCGPGEHVARHAARVLQELQTVGDVDGPAQLLQQLHERWRQGAHVGLFFTAWAAVYEPVTRRLSHACAGQHAALLRVPDGEIQRLETLNPPVGLLPGTEFIEDSLTVLPGSRLYVCNKGAFEFMDRSGRCLELDDFEALLACLPPVRGSVPEQAFAHLRRLAERDRLDDDFLLLQAEFAR
jgi:Stage II sporulation protein E (SpoIIE)/Inner membrane component of T3SS, cytoplasmic domain